MIHFHDTSVTSIYDAFTLENGILKGSTGLSEAIGANPSSGLRRPDPCLTSGTAHIASHLVLFMIPPWSFSPFRHMGRGTQRHGKSGVVCFVCFSTFGISDIYTHTEASKNHANVTSCLSWLCFRKTRWTEMEF